MKKFFKLMLVLTVCFMFGNTQAFAADPVDYIPHKVPVQLDEDFSTKNPPKRFSVTVPKEYVVKDIRTVEKGTRIYFDTTKVSKEKLAKMNATVAAKVVKVYIPSQDTYIKINNPNAIVKFSKYEPVDYTNKAIDAGISVANIFVKNVTYPAHFVKGAVQNKEGNRLKSGVKETYDSSVLSYVQKGEALIVKKGELVTMTYYTKNIKESEAMLNAESQTKE